MRGMEKGGERRKRSKGKKLQIELLWLDEINSRLDTAEKKRLVNFKAQLQKLSKMKCRGEKNAKEKNCETASRPHLCRVGVPEGEAMTGTEKLFEETMAKNFTNLMRTIRPQIQEAK